MIYQIDLIYFSTAVLTLEDPLAISEFMILLNSSRFTRLSKCLTGPIDAGLMDRLENPIAQRQTASIGRPASSPQKEIGVFNSLQRLITNLR